MKRYFINKDHFDFYNIKINQFEESHSYNSYFYKNNYKFISIIYLLASNEITRKHFDDIFDCKRILITPEVLLKDFHDEVSRAITGIVLNLYKGINVDVNDDGQIFELDQSVLEHHKGLLNMNHLFRIAKYAVEIRKNKDMPFRLLYAEGRRDAV